MNTINVIESRAKKSEVECIVQVLSDPRLSDPAFKSNIAGIESLSAVSPNGEWLAFIHRRLNFLSKQFTIAQTKTSTQEINVPLNRTWERLSVHGIANDGTFLFEAELYFEDRGYSCRPLLFKPGDKEPKILPPLYSKQECTERSLEDDRSRSHMPYCYAPDGTIFDWTHIPRHSGQPRRLHEKLHCVWKQQESGEWTIEYLPDYLNTKWVWPGYNSTFVWSDRPQEDRIIHFGLFDKSSKPFNTTLKGHDPIITAVASDNTFLGNYCINDGKRGAGKSSQYTFLAKPQDNAIRAFKGIDNLWLEQLSPNGKYIIGVHPGIAYFILKAENHSYRYIKLKTNGWRIEDLACIMDDSRIFALATCIERQHDCFRLKLPVLLTPQW